MTEKTLPLISIVTVNLNQADKLNFTLESVHKQSFENKEHIVIDGGSTDKSVGLIRQYEDRLADWVSEPDKGIYDAMNKGVKMAKGQWIHFMNAGDAYANAGSLQAIADKLDKRYWIAYCDILLKKPDQSLVPWKQKPLYRLGLFNNICHQAVFYNLKKWPEMQFDIRFEVSADARVLLEIASKAGWDCFKKIPGAFVIYEEEGLSYEKAYKALKSREDHFRTWLKNPLIRFWNMINLKRQQKKYLLNAKKNRDG